MVPSGEANLRTDFSGRCVGCATHFGCSLVTHPQAHFPVDFEHPREDKIQAGVCQMGNSFGSSMIGG